MNSVLKTRILHDHCAQFPYLPTLGKLKSFEVLLSVKLKALFIIHLINATTIRHHY